MKKAFRIVAVVAALGLSLATFGCSNGADDNSAALLAALAALSSKNQGATNTSGTDANSGTNAGGQTSGGENTGSQTGGENPESENTGSQSGGEITGGEGGENAGGQSANEEPQLTFLNDWEKMEFLYINDAGALDTKIDAPWNKTAASTLMPDNIRFDIKKSNGWDVAFDLMNQDGHPDKNYFGLYNKYTGVLRIFYYYNKEVATSANDFAFDIILGSNGNNIPAYYSALNYGIPMDVNVKEANLLGAGSMAKTFHFLTTPYANIDRQTMMQGWYAFDIDMSAYMGKSFYTDGSSIQIAFKANNKTNVSLGTDIIGKLCGDMNATIDRAQTTASSSGFGGAISAVADILGDTGGSSLRNIETKLCGGGLLGTSLSLNEGLSYLSAAMKAGMFVYNYFAGEDSVETPQDKLNGKIDLKCNLTADTSGYLESAVSTNVKQITLGKTAFNPDSNIGAGVWNINTSPVIYVLNNTMLYWDPNTDNSKRQCFVVNVVNSDCLSFPLNDFLLLDYPGDDVTKLHDPKYYRLPYIYDPTSFDVTINKDIFPDAQNIKVFSYCGIYANNGNSASNDSFREALGLTDPSMPNISKIVDYNHVTGVTYSYFNPNEEYRINLDGGNGMYINIKGRWIVGTRYDYVQDNWDDTNARMRFVNCSPEAYKDAIIKFDDLSYVNYSGAKGDNGESYLGQKIALGNKSSAYDFIVEPQIFYNGYDIQKFPEMYVVVIVQFESDGKTFSYSRTYLPKIQKLSLNHTGIRNLSNAIETRAAAQPEKRYGMDEYLKALKKKTEILGVELESDAQQAVQVPEDINNSFEYEMGLYKFRWEIQKTHRRPIITAKYVDSNGALYFNNFKIVWLIDDVVAQCSPCDTFSPDIYSLSIGTHTLNVFGTNDDYRVGASAIGHMSDFGGVTIKRIK